MPSSHDSTTVIPQRSQNQQEIPVMPQPAPQAGPQQYFTVYRFLGGHCTKDVNGRAIQNATFQNVDSSKKRVSAIVVGCYEKRIPTGRYVWVLVKDDGLMPKVFGMGEVGADEVEQAVGKLVADDMASPN